ncbi:CoA ester lyase [Pseudonocardia sp. RS11V-5]|uniref:HpcH/HpaI aldolase/citrate lyase family protein n=1 Tax=Pseudonocardia terrae TaxID=2905831 RepID=UPI001E62DCA4|nr:CoA ester lyase [Pseudonocardia terrae]MCE3552250.1 CoA ester lyase [Pseudonocardia terrae]
MTVTESTSTSVSGPAAAPRTALGRARSWLYVPAHRTEVVAKALAGAADAVVLDLEDAVPAGAKAAARESAASVSRGRLPVWVRMNGTGTPWAADDVAALAGADVDGVRVPKADDPAAVAALADRLGHPLHLLLENALGLERAFALATCHPLVAGLSLGEADLAADLRVRGAGLEWARGRVVVAARAAGLPSPVASVWTDLADPEGLAADSVAARDAGFFGRSVIHPAQIDPVHRAFTPDADEVARARELLGSLASAGESARVDPRGRFVDPAVVAGARWVVELAETLADPDPSPHEPVHRAARTGKELP